MIGLDELDRAVWCATYAAAFVACDNHGKARVHLPSRVESAVATANLAVEGLKALRKRGREAQT